MYRKLRVGVHNHQHKADALIGALLLDGHEVAHEIKDLDILLVDHDRTDYYKKLIDEGIKDGAKIVMYPHGATGFLAWDIYSPDERVSAYFAIGRGQYNIMKQYGYPHPVYVTGWHWTELKHFRKVDEIKNILFAPIHPLSNGFLCEARKKANRDAFKAARSLGGNLTVRYVGNLEDNGLRELKSVSYQKASYDTMLSSIDKADLVISCNTFAHIAVARGAPTIMYKEEGAFSDGDTEEAMTACNSWNAYRYYWEYPLSFAKDRNIKTLAELAIRSDIDIEVWKDNFISTQFNPYSFPRLLMRVLEVENASL
jgi:hypothetical protein